MRESKNTQPIRFPQGEVRPCCERSGFFPVRGDRFRHFLHATSPVLLQSESVFPARSGSRRLRLSQRRLAGEHRRPHAGLQRPGRLHLSAPARSVFLRLLRPHSRRLFPCPGRHLHLRQRPAADRVDAPGFHRPLCRPSLRACCAGSPPICSAWIIPGIFRPASPISISSARACNPRCSASCSSSRFTPSCRQAVAGRDVVLAGRGDALHVPALRRLFDSVLSLSPLPREALPRRLLSRACSPSPWLRPCWSTISSTFAPSSPEAFAEAQHLLAHFRLPHHADARRWFDGIACAQIVWVVVALFLVRGTRLFPILALPFVLSLVLTLVQMGTGNDTLALLFPWRTSAILVPLATTIILARLVNASALRFRPPTLDQQRAISDRVRE